MQQQVRKTVVFVTHDVDEAVRLGDRIAVLREGGYLEQYDVPATILGAPASPFVADFVGNDRAVKRLAVTPLRTATLAPLDGWPDAAVPGRPVPTVAETGSLADALAALLAGGTGWVVVCAADSSPTGLLTPDVLYAAAVNRGTVDSR